MYRNKKRSGKKVLARPIRLKSTQRFNAIHKSHINVSQKRTSAHKNRWYSWTATANLTLIKIHWHRFITATSTNAKQTQNNRALCSQKNKKKTKTAQHFMTFLFLFFVCFNPLTKQNRISAHNSLKQV